MLIGRKSPGENGLLTLAMGKTFDIFQDFWNIDVLSI
jgi:hypothetical protein